MKKDFLSSFKKAFTKCVVGGGIVSAIPLIAASCSQVSQLRATMIVDEVSWRDGGFLEAGYNGMLEAKKVYAEHKINLKITLPQVAENSSYFAINNAIRIAINNGAGVVIGVGFTEQASFSFMAKLHPNLVFLVIDATSKGSNVYNYAFPEQEAGYLTGVLNGLIAKMDPQRFGKKTDGTATINFTSIGGAAIPTVERYIWGFRIGLEYVADHVTANGPKISGGDTTLYDSILKEDPVIRNNKHVLNTKLNYQGSRYLKFVFANQNNKGTLTATDDFQSKKTDVIFEVAGGTGFGIVSAAKQINQGKAPTKYVVGADYNWYNNGAYIVNGKTYSVIINSAIKNLKLASLEFMQWVYTHGPYKNVVNNRFNFPKVPAKRFVAAGDKSNVSTALVQNKDVGTTPNLPDISKGIQKVYNDFYESLVGRVPIGQTTPINLNPWFYWTNATNVVWTKPPTPTDFFKSQDLKFSCKEGLGQKITITNW